MKRIFLFAMMLGLAAACSGKAAEPQRPVVYMTTEISPTPWCASMRPLTGLRKAVLP